MSNLLLINIFLLILLAVATVAGYFRIKQQKIRCTQQEDRIKHLQLELSAQQAGYKQQIEATEQQLTLSHIKVAKLETQIAAETKQANDKEQWLTKSSASLTEQFKLLSNQVLTENQQIFKQQSQTTINDSLSPLKEEIQKLQHQAVQISKEDQRDRSSLRTMLEIYKQEFANSCNSLNQEAANLTRALKGDNKAQGDWGEIILERILENVGLNKGQEYDIQQSFTDETGKRLRPDVIVHLPDNKDIIIDSKVSLTAYSKAIAETNSDKEKYLSQHVLSIKNHIKELAGKNYEYTDNDLPIHIRETDFYFTDTFKSKQKPVP